MRMSMSLNGRWKFYPAFERFSGDLRWMDPGFDPKNPDATPKDREVGWIGEHFDDSGWMDIPVPGSWNSSIEDLWSYEGHGWYRRTVMIPAAWKGKRVEFFSEGANYRTEVYVNGRFAGEHEGGYTPFAIPIHHLLKFGERNVIAVACDNEPKPERVPGGKFAWWNHGGLYRDVSLRVTDTVYIDDVTVVTDIEGDRARVRVDVVVRSEEDQEVERTLEVLLLDPSGDAVPLRSDVRSQVLKVADGRAETTMEFEVEDAHLWSPEEPNLYTLRLTLLDAGRPADEWSHRIGLRTIRIEGTRLLLNGRPLHVKGLNRHEEYEKGGMSTPTHTEAGLCRDLDLVKWLGANALRCHYPNHRRFYELCDERGILNVVEVPLWQWGHSVVETDSLEALDVAKRMLREIIRTYKNHACVFIWSVSNENFVVPRAGEADDPDAVALAKRIAEGNRELVALAKELDPTRPVVEVSNHWPEDPVLEVTDLLAVNAYVGYPSPPLASEIPQTYRLIHERLEALRARIPDKPILVAEFGKWTVRGLMTDYPYGEYFQAEKFKVEWEGFLKEPNFVGAFIWCFADYDLHRRYLFPSEYRIAYGVFDIKRRPKAVAHVIRELWTR